MKALQESMKDLQANKKRMLSSICHVRSLLQEEMQFASKFTDIPKISDATPITSVLESAYNDSNTQVVDIMKSHLDSQVFVLGNGYTSVPKNISPFVLFSASIDTTELEFSPFSFSSKGPTLLVKDDRHKHDMEFDDKVFDRMPNMDIFVEFHAPSTTIGSLPPSFGLHDCKWVDSGRVSDSFDIEQYYQIKLLHKQYVGQILIGLNSIYLNDYYIFICCYLTNWVDTEQALSDDSGYAPLLIVPLSFSSDAHKLFVKIAKRSGCVPILYDSDYTGQVGVFIECSENLTSFCNSYSLQSKSLDTSFLYSLDGAVTSIVEIYKIGQLRSLEVDYKRIIDALPLRSASAHVARRMVDALATVNLSHHDKNMRISTLRIFRHYDPLTDSTSMSGQSLEKIMDYPQTKVDFHGINAIHLRILVEEMSLLIAISRKVILLIFNAHMNLCAGWIVEEYIHIVLDGIIGTFHNCFIYLWNPTRDYIAVFLHQSFGLVWRKYIEFLDHSPPVLLGSSHKVAPNARELLETANYFLEILDLMSIHCLIVLQVQQF